MALFKPNPEEVKARARAYDQLMQMQQLKDKKMPHFANQYGERSFNEYIDDSERILNGYIFSRESQNKEEWQSNLIDNITRAKLRAIVTSVALRPPPISFTAVNEEGVQSAIRAEIFKEISGQTYRDSNPKLQAFLEVWKMLSHGVLFEYEGYQTGGAMQRRVESFDSQTGAIKEKSEYVKSDSKPFCATLDPQEFYWWDMFLSDIQDQPHIAWVQHYTKKQLETEFSKYPNYAFVKDKSQAARLSPEQQETLYFTKWSSMVEKSNDYAVFRRYSLEDDAYEIWINGIPMLLAPMLWGDTKKYYPFPKTICEPFANPNFFVGMSLPGILEAYQDGKNTVLNTMIDKLYRSMDPAMLIGLQNKDLFDWESEFIQRDNRYYVPDIEAVKFNTPPSINQGELAMLQILDRGIESVSISAASQGIPQGNVTATADKLAAIKAEQLKSGIYVFLEDLWMQKYRLRTRTILTHYLKDKAAADTIKGNIITVPDYEFGDGSRGTLAIHIAKTPKDLMPVSEIAAREAAAEKEGKAYKLISIPADYMDSWQFDFTIGPKAFQDEAKAEQEAALKDELSTITTLFPEFFVSNKDKYLSDVLSIYGKHPSEYKPAAQLPPPAPTPGAGEQTPSPQPKPQETVQSILGLQ